MANNSYAYGKLILEGDWHAFDIDALLIVFEKIENWGYWTELALKTHMQKHEKLTRDGFIEFSGNGRWAFNTNLKNLNYWLDDEPYVKGENFKNALRTLKAAMEKKDLHIVWNYSDCEGGNDFIVLEEGYHYVKDDELKYDIVHHESYAHTLKNYHEHVLHGKDDGTLADAFHDIAELLGIDPQIVYDKVMAHETFYDLGLWHYYDTKDDIPEELVSELVRQA